MFLTIPKIVHVKVLGSRQQGSVLPDRNFGRYDKIVAVVVVSAGLVKCHLSMAWKITFRFLFLMQINPKENEHTQRHFPSLTKLSIRCRFSLSLLRQNPFQLGLSF